MQSYNWFSYEMFLVLFTSERSAAKWGGGFPVPGPAALIGWARSLFQGAVGKAALQATLGLRGVPGAEGPKGQPADRGEPEDKVPPPTART